MAHRNRSWKTCVSDIEACVGKPTRGASEMRTDRMKRRGTALWSSVGGALVILALAISPAVAHTDGAAREHHLLLTSNLFGASSEEATELETMLGQDEQGDDAQGDESEAPESEAPESEAPDASEQPEASDQGDQGENADENDTNDEQGDDAGDAGEHQPAATERASSGEEDGGDGGHDGGSGSDDGSGGGDD
jgi:hypothetical protein